MFLKACLLLEVSKLDKMTKKRISKKTVILWIASLLSILILSNFSLTKEIYIAYAATGFLVPSFILLPLLYLFFYGNIAYLQFSYAEGKTLVEKILYAILNTGIFMLIFKAGFEFYSYSHGNMDIIFKGESKNVFQLNFRNLFFWVIYQSIWLAYGFSVLKILVSRTKK